MKVVIDVERCTGHGRCYVVAPSLFADDDRGFGQVLDDGNVAGDHEATARAAVMACPEHAIAWSE